MKQFLFILVIFGVTEYALAQQIEEAFLSDIPIISINNFSEEEALKLDEKQGYLNRFASQIPQEISFINQAKEITDGNIVTYKLRLQIREAQGMALILHNLKLEGSAILTAYDPYSNEKLIYTAKDNPTNGRFLLGPFTSADIIIEYQTTEIYSKSFKIASALPIYKTINQQNRDFGDAMDCQANINCDEASELAKEKRAILRLLCVTELGLFWCSGSLINNTAKDGKPYVLTAFHCADGLNPDYSLWRFNFNYEFIGCNDDDEPSFQSYWGGSFRAGNQASDFLLLEINHELPAELHAYFNGWNRSDNIISPVSHFIHHPEGDVKKYARDNDAVSVWDNWLHWNNDVSSPPNTHYVARFELGTIEPGSSGAPLLDMEGLIIGQLHGGQASCTEKLNSFYGRLNLAWPIENGMDDTGLQPWLDPVGSGQMILEGMENPANLIAANISGVIKNYNDEGVANVQIFLDSFPYIKTTTNQDGFFHLSGVPRNITHKLNISKNENPLNGITASDILRIQKHLLGIEPFTFDYQSLAADVNKSSSISALDMIEIRKLILLINNEFPLSKSWAFMPEELLIPIGADDINDLFIEAVKMGDANGSADPK